jgi:putative transposase
MARPSRPSPPQNAKASPRTFFVTSRTAAGKPLLQSDCMAALFIHVLRGYVKDGKFKVLEFVVMPNHVYLLITVEGGMSIEKAMQLIKGGFSYRAKKELGFLGEVWQRGFSDVRVRDEESFAAHRLYIHNNPVKAGLVGVAEEYAHGSLFLRRLKAQGLTPEVKLRQSARLKSCPDAGSHIQLIDSGTPSPQLPQKQAPHRSAVR